MQDMLGASLLCFNALFGTVFSSFYVSGMDRGEVHTNRLASDSSQCRLNHLVAAQLATSLTEPLPELWLSIDGAVYLTMLMMSLANVVVWARNAIDAWEVRQLVAQQQVRRGP